MPTVSSAWTAMASTISSAAMLVTSTLTVFKTAFDPDVKPMQKLLTVMMQIGFILPNIINLIKSFKSEQGILNLATIVTGKSLSKAFKESEMSAIEFAKS